MWQFIIISLWPISLGVIGFLAAEAGAGDASQNEDGTRSRRPQGC